jgi:predicted transcriptional regulator YdeE
MNNEPTLTQLQPLALAGLETRTTNALEANPATARIGENWQQFFARGLGQTIPNQTNPHKLYGVYTHYQSDFRGEYSQLVAVAVTIADAEAMPDLSVVRVPEARYLVFSGSGEMPQVALQVWQQVWAYFAQSACPHQRAYTTDFEVYDSTRPSMIEIYIAV